MEEEPILWKNNWKEEPILWKNNCKEEPILRKNNWGRDPIEQRKIQLFLRGIFSGFSWAEREKSGSDLMRQIARKSTIYNKKK